jgi:Arylsulfotransferase (ASST)
MRGVATLAVGCLLLVPAAATGAGSGAALASVPARSTATTLHVSTTRPVAGDTVRARAVLRVSGVATCTLLARRADGTSRRTVGPATVRDGTARWRVDTTGWSAGGWTLRADCGRRDASRAIRVVAPPGPPPASDSFSTPGITTTPALTPRYRPGIPDYVVRCRPGIPVDVQVDSAPGTWVSVDRGTWASGSFSRSVQLAAGQRFTVKVAGGSRTETASIRCLPTDFPTLDASGRAPDGWYLTSYPYLSGSPYVMVLDRYGTPVWWYDDVEFGNPVDMRFWSASELSAFGWPDRPAVSWVGGTTYVLRRLDGSEITRWGGGLGLDRHDLDPTPRGTVFTIRYVRRNCPAVPSECVDMTAYGGGASDVLVDAEILELNRSGQVVWKWSTRDHIGLGESARLLEHPAHLLRNADGSWDLTHINSVDAVKGGVVFSARHLDALYRVNRSTGDIVWKIGGTRRPESLTVVNGGVSGIPLAMQHDARVLPDGTVTVYDNGTTMSRPPRMVRFSVDAAAGTATVVQVVRDTRIASSGFAGSARRLTDGSWLMAWGGNDMVTVNRPDGTALLTIRSTLPNGDKGVPYRAVPVTPAQLTAGALRAGMDAMHPRP